MGLVIHGSWEGGSEFSVDPRWWQDSGRSTDMLLRRLQAPLSVWDDSAGKHIYKSRRVATLELWEDGVLKKRLK